MISSSVCSLQVFVRLPGLSCEHKFQLLTQPPPRPPHRTDTKLCRVFTYTLNRCQDRSVMLRPVEEPLALSLSTPLVFRSFPRPPQCVSEANTVMMGKRAPSSKPPHICVCLCVCALGKISATAKHQPSDQKIQLYIRNHWLADIFTVNSSYINFRVSGGLIKSSIVINTDKQLRQHKVMTKCKILMCKI